MLEAHGFPRMPCPLPALEDGVVVAPMFFGADGADSNMASILFESTFLYAK